TRSTRDWSSDVCSSDLCNDSSKTGHYHEMCKAFTLGRRFPRARPQPPSKQALSPCSLRGLWTRPVPAGVVCLPCQPAIGEGKQTTRISMKFCSFQGFLIQPLLCLLKSA